MKKMNVIFIVLATMIIISYQNCAKPVAFSGLSDETVGIGEGVVDDSEDPIDNAPPVVIEEPPVVTEPPIVVVPPVKPDEPTDNGCAKEASGNTSCKFEDTDSSGVATLAFEDNYAATGDNDYNDYLVNLNVSETYNPNGGLEKIVIEYTPKSKLSGNDFQLLLDFDGIVRKGNLENSKENVVQAYKTSEMFAGSANIVYEQYEQSVKKKTSNVSKDSDLVLFSSARQSIDNKLKAIVTITGFDKSKNTLSQRGGVSLNRFRTVLRVINTGYDIDISDINPNLFDDKKMPLAFFVPTDWRAPAEGQYIGNVYSKFEQHADFMNKVLLNTSLVEKNESKYWYRYPIK